MIYIASPFFNSEDVAFIQRIEKELEENDILYYSPRSGGILGEMTDEEVNNSKAEIYQSNINMIKVSDIIIAVIDGRDTGTIWEMGYATALGKDIISISNHDYGLNVMLAESVRIHVKDMSSLIEAVKNNSLTSDSTNNLY